MVGMRTMTIVRNPEIFSLNFLRLQIKNNKWILDGFRCIFGYAKEVHTCQLMSWQTGRTSQRFSCIVARNMNSTGMGLVLSGPFLCWPYYNRDGSPFCGLIRILKMGAETMGSLEVWLQLHNPKWGRFLLELTNICDPLLLNFDRSLSLHPQCQISRKKWLYLKIWSHLCTVVDMLVSWVHLKTG